MGKLFKNSSCAKKVVATPSKKIKRDGKEVQLYNIELLVGHRW